VLVAAVGVNSEWGKTMLLVGTAGGDATPLQEKLEVVAGAVGKVGAGQGLLHPAGPVPGSASRVENCASAALPTSGLALCEICGSGGD
jgi:hypothetical protein